MYLYHKYATFNSLELECNAINAYIKKYLHHIKTIFLTFGFLYKFEYNVPILSKVINQEIFACNMKSKLFHFDFV